MTSATCGRGHSKTLDPNLRSVNGEGRVEDRAHRSEPNEGVEEFQSFREIGIRSSCRQSLSCREVRVRGSRHRRERETERERDIERDRETERETERERDIERDRETERETERARETERDRNRDRDRERESILVSIQE
jgi:hypothetical protein